MAAKRTPLDAAYISVGTSPVCEPATPARRPTPDPIEATMRVHLASIVQEYAPLLDALAKT